MKPMKPLTIEQLRGMLAEMDENIADLLRTAVDAADDRGWDDPVAIGASAEAHWWMERREGVAIKLRAVRAAQAELVA